MKRIKPDSKKNRSLFTFIKRHKVLSVIGTLVIIAGILTAIGYYHVYQEYRKRLTDKDYSAIEAMAKDVIKKVGGGMVTDNKECSYERPGVYADLHLYCSVEVASYTPYESGENALKIGKSLEREVSKMGAVLSSLDSFYNELFNAQDVVVVNLAPPLPRVQCNFYIFSNNKVMNAVAFLPKKTTENLIALSFECSAQSRGEYFPVTYRQG